MKRTIALLLSLVCLLSLSACGAEKEKKKENKVDLEYYAQLGQIPDCPYKLGADPDEIISELEAAAEEAEQNNEEYPFGVTEGEKTVRIDNGAYVYFYAKESPENGIAYIVAADGAYGFESGTTALEVKNALPTLDYTEEEANEDNAFFLYGISNGTVLRYTPGDRTVLFLFSDNALVAVALYDNLNWNF